MMPPSTPQTTGAAVWGALLPTMGTLTGGAMAGSGASGTLGKLPATVSVVPVTALPAWEGAPETVSTAWPATGISGAPSVSGTKLARRTKERHKAVRDIFLADCGVS